MLQHIIPHLLFAVLLLPTCLMADILSQGREAIKSGQPEKAHALFSATASRGEAKGAYGMGVLFSEGWHVTKDLTQAIDWFRKSAEQGYAPAQFNLGNVYYKGHGIESDPVEAGHWWHQAARQGHSQAQFNLGMLLYNEGTTPEEKEQGIAWAREAATRGIEWAGQQLLSIGEPLNYANIWFDAGREPMRSEARIMTQPPNRYTIHLMSAQQLTSGVDTIKNHRLEGRALLFRYRQKGQRWHGLVYGVYESREEAAKTIISMKEALKKGKPWIRSISSVQRSINDWREKKQPAIK